MIKRFFIWLRGSLEGTDGKASSKALTIFLIAFLALSVHTVNLYIGIRISEKQVATDASLKVMDRLRDILAIDYTFLAILIGVASVQSLISGIKAIRGVPDSEPILIEKKTSETITQIDKVHPSNSKDHEI